MPPDRNFKGKILFIFSNPDRLAESSLHLSLENQWFGTHHFIHMATADREWLHRLGDSTKQNKYNNLLSYDALGCNEHLQSWLQTKTIPCSMEEAQILGVKYENLWESESDISKFLGFDIQLPPKYQRGYQETQLSPLEQEIREKYNLGTMKEPRYAAYDEARNLWENAPSLRYLTLS